MKQKTDIVEKVVLKYPKLFKEGTEEEVKKLLNTITHKKNELSELHIKYMQLEQELSTMQNDIRPILSLVEVHYKEIEVEDKVHGECNLVINNPEDARNLK